MGEDRDRVGLVKPLEVVHLALDLGVTLKPEGKRIKATPSDRITDELRQAILQNKEALIDYLTYDHETAYELLRAARAYISERYTTGSELDTENLDERIAQAEIKEDMWALRIAVRRWVLAWVQAISRAREVAA